MIIIQFDQKYLRWAQLMLQTLALFEPEQKILLDTIGLAPQQVTALTERHPGVCISNDPDGLPGGREAMVCRKPFVMQRAMDTYPDEPWYCLMDADSLIRRPLTRLWRYMAIYPTAIMMTNGLWRGRVYQHLITPSAIVMARPDGRLLIDNWVKWTQHDQPMFNIKPGGWFWDQICLSYAWRESKLPYGNIGCHHHANGVFSGDATIWSAHVEPHEKDWYFEQFQRETNRLLRETGTLEVSRV